MKSLGTKDRKTAEVLVRKMGSHYDELFAEALSGDAEVSKDSSSLPQNLLPKTLPLDYGLGIEDSHIYAAHFLQLLRKSRERFNAEGNISVFNKSLDVMVESTAEYLSTGVHSIDEPPAPMWRYEAEVRAINALRENRDLPQIEASKQHQAPKKQKRNHHLYLTEIVDKWAKERKVGPKFAAEMKRVIGRFDAISGDVPAAEITRQHCVKFKDALLEEGMSLPNLNQYLTDLNIILNYCKSQGIVDINAAVNLKVKESTSARAKRLPFDLTALQKIFDSPVYTQGARPLAGGGEAAYWLPLLSLYTGGRLNELCQLHVKDIYIDNYSNEGKNHDVWMLNITDEGEGQELKNSGSRRQVPIHKDLIAVGFLDYVRGIKGVWLFPDLNRSATYNSLSANWSKWFGRYLRKVVHVTDRRMVFHSFRHCFKHYARNSGIPAEVHHALTGHSTGNVGDNYGSDKYPLKPLVESMLKFQVPGLVLPKVQLE